MKTLAFSLVVLSLALPASAQTFLAKFQTKAETLEKTIKDSKLSPDAKAGFTARLTKIEGDVCGKTAGFDGKSGFAGKTCAATPSKVEDADDALQTLSDDVAAAIKTGPVDINKLYAPQLAVLKSKVDGGMLATTDKTALDKRIATFFDFGSKNPGVKAPDLAALAAEKFSTLKDDVDAVLTLAKDKTNAHDGFVTAFEAKVHSVTTTIKDSKLNADFKADFTTRLNKIISDACPETAAAISAAKGAGKLNCAKATPEKIEAADGNLKDLGDEISETINLDGSKSLADVYAPQIVKLKADLAAAKIDKIDLDALNKRITAFQDQLKADFKGLKSNVLYGEKPGTLGKLKKTHDDNVQKAADDFAKLQADAAAAVALSKEGADSKGFLAAFEAKVAALKKTINGSKLNKDFKTDYLNQTDAITKEICKPRIGAGAANGAVDCKLATPSKLSTADGQVDALAADVADTIKLDGSESLASVYAPQIAALKKSLAGAKVDKADLDALNKRIGAFSDSLNADFAGPKGAMLSFEKPGALDKRKKDHEDKVQQAATDFAALQADVNAAIALSKPAAPVKPN